MAVTASVPQQLCNVSLSFSRTVPKTRITRCVVTAMAQIHHNIIAHTHSRGVQLLQGQAYSDSGATAYDAVDGAVSSVASSGPSAINSLVVSSLHQCVDILQPFIPSSPNSANTPFPSPPLPEPPPPPRPTHTDSRPSMIIQGPMWMKRTSEHTSRQRPPQHAQCSRLSSRSSKHTSQRLLNSIVALRALPGRIGTRAKS